MVSIVPDAVAFGASTLIATHDFYHRGVYYPLYRWLFVGCFFAEAQNEILAVT